MTFAAPFEPVIQSMIDLSFVVPFLDERESLEILYGEIVHNCEVLGKSFEIIFVDDGSKDGGSALVERLMITDPRLSLIRFRRNFGKSAALSAGFEAARGQVVFSMDADLQDDPAEVGNFLAALDAGADVVSGWKQVRNDPLDKTLPSRLFNAVVNRTFGLGLRDHNCGFKAYRREALEELNLYGEMHRFVPALLHARGFAIGQIPVQHRARRFGVSKFGAKRLIKGALDLLTVWLNTRYGARPLHLFGGGGLLLAGAGGAMLAYLAMLWMLGLGPIGNRPLLLFGMLLVLFGGQMITVGLLGELMLSRTIGEKDKYAVRSATGAAFRRELPVRVLAGAPHRP